MLNSGARISELTVVLSILYGRLTLCSPKLSFSCSIGLALETVQFPMPK